MVFPIVTPPNPRGVMILTNLNLHYVTNLPLCKFDLAILAH